MLRGAATALAFGLGACATTPNATSSAFAERSAANSFEFFDRSVDPPSTLLLPLEHDRQVNGIACGAHALASIANYWLGPAHVSGEALFAASPPADLTTGYSMAELLALAREQGLLASAVRLREVDILRELEAGRQMLVPARVPSVFVEPWQFPGATITLLGVTAAVGLSLSARPSVPRGRACFPHPVPYP